MRYRALFLFIIAFLVTYGITRGEEAPPMSAAQWREKQLDAAKRADDLLREAEKYPGLLAQYEFLHNAYSTDTDKAFRLIFGQYLSWYQTFLGFYADARNTFSIFQVPEKNDSPSPLNNPEYTVRPAREVIIELAKGRKAVFFNEAHSVPVTRTLTIQVLAQLRKEGFNYFAAETLYETDKDLQKRGYPIAESGFYTREPIYGEMVRTALKLGYKVVAYEASDEAMGETREQEEAQHLYARVFKHNPNARLVVNAGYGHIQESGKYLKGVSMAQKLKKMTGIDPLTIEQTMLYQHAKSDMDHPVYLAAVAAFQPSEPIVFVNHVGKPWSLKGNAYDMSVIFPPDNIEQDRPTWLSLGGLRQPYGISGNLCRKQFPCLIEARYINEGKDAIPADRLVLEPIPSNPDLADRLLQNMKMPQAELYLRPGRYYLSVTDINNRHIKRQDITVGTLNKDTP